MMTTSFVLSGGGSLGAVQVGMLQALSERGIVPDTLVGTSAGALNAVFVAGSGTSPEDIASLAEVWRSLRTWQLFPPDPRRALRALLGHTDSLFSDRGLRDLVERHLVFDRLEDAPIPLTVIATDLLSGLEVALTRGPTVDAVLASCAIPGVLPPVAWGGLTLADGGLADNTAISQAVRAGADHVYVLPTGYPCSLTEPPHTPLGILGQSMAVLVHQRLVRDIEQFADRVDLVVLPPPCPVTTSALDFSNADELIRRAYDGAVDFLARDSGRREHPARHIALHAHHQVVDAPSSRAGMTSPRSG